MPISDRTSCFVFFSRSNLPFQFIDFRVQCFVFLQVRGITVGHMFDVCFSGKNEEEKHVQMEKTEREKFELLLISNPFITPVQSEIRAWE